MTAAKIKDVNVSFEGYRILTPAHNVNTNTASLDYYNNELFENFLHTIINSTKNKIKDGAKYFHLVSLNQSNDGDFLEGKIHTTRYGTLSDIIDTSTDQVVTQLEPKQGVVNELNFVINKKNGLLLVQKDPFRIFNRTLLLDFLEKRKDLAINLVDDFNRKYHPNILSIQNFFTIQTIYDEDFYKQIARMANIKSVSITPKIEKADINSAQAKLATSLINENEYMDEITEVTYTFKNSLRNQGVKGVERFIRNALDIEKIQSIYAEGTEYGKRTIATFKIKPRTFYVKTTKNDFGVLDQSKIIIGMISQAKKFSFK